MKRIVLIVVGALVAIAMIPIIVVSINRITQEKVREEVVTFEVLTETTVTPGTYSKINEYAIFVNDVVTNLLNITHNGTSDSIGVPYISIYNVSSYSIRDVDDDDPEIAINNNDIITLKNDSVLVGDIFEITLEVTTPAQVTGIGAALLGLVPILFVLGTVFSLVIFTKELE